MRGLSPVGGTQISPSFLSSFPRREPDREERTYRHSRRTDQQLRLRHIQPAGTGDFGNLESLSDPNGNRTYQLTSAGSEIFSYDRTGNRTTSGYSHNANNELLTTATASYTYDENGNTQTKTINGQTTTYDYDARNRLVQVSLPDGGTATYAYDPFGRRTSKTVNGQTTCFIYSDEGLIGEYDAAGNLQKGYGWLPDGTWGTNPQFQVENGNYYYYHNDHLGTPQRLTDEAGNTVWSTSYSAFGQATVGQNSTVTNNLRYPGQYWDEETGLHYNWNRYYDPEAGRYTQVDPIGFAAGDGNLYRYVGNWPLNGVDPEGLYDASDFLYDFSNVLIGIGDTVSLGLTAKIRQINGTDGSVDKCSGAYRAGQVAGTAIDLAVGGVAVKGGAKLVGKLGVRRGFKSGKTFYRNMSRVEAEAVKQSGKLRGGNLGETFFTDSRYRSAKKAQDRLSLRQRPEVQMEFRINNNPRAVRNGTKVKPDYGGRGGGKEFMTTDPVDVEIVNIQPY